MAIPWAWEDIEFFSFDPKRDDLTEPKDNWNGSQLIVTDIPPTARAPETSSRPVLRQKHKRNWGFLDRFLSASSAIAIESKKRSAQIETQARKRARPQTEGSNIQHQSRVTQSVRASESPKPHPITTKKPVAALDTTAARSKSRIDRPISLIPWYKCTVLAIFDEWKYGSGGQLPLKEMLKELDFSPTQRYNLLFRQDVVARLSIFLLVDMILKKAAGSNVRLAFEGRAGEVAACGRLEAMIKERKQSIYQYAFDLRRDPNSEISKMIRSVLARKNK